MAVDVADVVVGKPRAYGITADDVIGTGVSCAGGACAGQRLTGDCVAVDQTGSAERRCPQIQNRAVSLALCICRNGQQRRIDGQCSRIGGGLRESIVAVVGG